MDETAYLLQLVCPYAAIVCVVLVVLDASVLSLALVFTRHAVHVHIHCMHVCMLMLMFPADADVSLSLLMFREA